MAWQDLSYEFRGAVISTTLGIFCWVAWFVVAYKDIYYSEIPGLGVVVALVIALFSIIPLWLLGLFIGYVTKKLKKPKQKRR
ncbi:MAG: hypothetical protein ABIH59_02145 [archaeon]